ncbi:MAG: 2-amino-4-hydroxy-6-hydroxymethyldihydropteridine diphosphokinase [Thiothrix sp.]
MPRAYISLGSNIDPETHICACIQRLRQDFPDLICSLAYQTPAEGFAGAPFLNLTAGFTTGQSYTELKQYLRTLEDAQGRIRNGEKFSSRTLDADLLLYGDLLLPEQNLPHKDILGYAFVLYPLMEIAPALTYPGRQQTVSELASQSALPRHTLSPIDLDCLRQ